MSLKIHECLWIPYAGHQTCSLHYHCWENLIRHFLSVVIQFELLSYYARLLSLFWPMWFDFYHIKSDYAWLRVKIHVLTHGVSAVLFLITLAVRELCSLNATFSCLIYCKISNVGSARYGNTDFWSIEWSIPCACHCSSAYKKLFLSEKNKPPQVQTNKLDFFLLTCLYL